MMRGYLPLLVAVASLAAEGCAADSCFVRGTRVATEDGERPIEALAVGDVVLSYSHAENAVVPRRIVAVHRSLAIEVRTIEIVARGAPEDAPGKSLEVTPSHPFWVESRKEYVPARDLRAGDELLLRDGREVRHAVIRSISAREFAAPTIEVFNISVEVPESNYFAGNVLVHNKEPLVRQCEDADVVVGATTKVADEASGATRHRFEVTTPRAASLKVQGFGRRAGAAQADVPLRVLTATSADDGRRGTVEFVVDAGLGATLVVSGNSTASDGASCSISKTVDPLAPH